MAVQDKIVLMDKVEGTLKTRMFANLLEEAVDEINTTLDDFDVKYLADNGEQTQVDFLTSYLNAKKVEGRAESTLTKYAYSIRKFMEYAQVSTRDVTTFHVRSYLTYKQKAGCKDLTLQGIRNDLNAYFSWLEHEKLIKKNPVFNVATIKCEKIVRKAFTMSEIEKMRRSCKTPRESAIIAFLLSTGCRVSEMTKLNRSDINFENNECIVDGKGRKERVVYLDDVAVMALKEYFDDRFDTEPELFIGKRLERLTPHGVRAMLKKLEERSGVKNIHPHRFRRTMITHMLDHGMPLQVIALIAGHDKLDTTMKYYASSNTRLKNEFFKYAS